MYAQSSQPTGVLVTQVQASECGGARFTFNATFDSWSEPLAGLGLYYPSSGWRNDLLIDGVPDEGNWIIVSGGIGEMATGWRVIPPVVGIAWTGGKALTDVQSGVTVPWVQ